MRTSSGPGVGIGLDPRLTGFPTSVMKIAFCILTVSIDLDLFLPMFGIVDGLI